MKIQIPHFDTIKKDRFLTDTGYSEVMSMQHDHTTFISVTPVTKDKPPKTDAPRFIRSVLERRCHDPIDQDDNIIRWLEKQYSFDPKVHKLKCVD